MGSQGGQAVISYPTKNEWLLTVRIRPTEVLGKPEPQSPQSNSTGLNLVD